MYNTLPRIWTVNEISEYLKVDDNVVINELENGSLNGFKIMSEWRCTENDLLAYITRPRTIIEDDESNEPELNTGSVRNVWNIVETEPFDFNWPKKGGSKAEHYDKGFNATRLINGHQITFRLGFGNRKAAGKERRRVTIWNGNRAIVEFAGSNNYENDGLLASVIKLKNNKQLTYQKIPGEYKNFNLKRYNTIVKGPRASTSLAIVVNKDDLKSMLEHAMIRATWKQLL